MKAGDRLYLPSATEPSGAHAATVTRVFKDGSFKVTWDSHGRKSGVPRQRQVLPHSAAVRFHVEPPQYTEE